MLNLKKYTWVRQGTSTRVLRGISEECRRVWCKEKVAGEAGFEPVGSVQAVWSYSGHPYSLCGGFRKNPDVADRLSYYMKES